jgi:hypothetical protein
LQAQLENMLHNMLHNDWIRASASPYGAPVLFARKKD